MSDDELEKIRLRKAEMLLNLQSMPKEVIEVKSEDEFNNLIKQFPDKIFVIDFWAEWCAPCKLYAHTFAKAHQNFSIDYIFIKINVDDNPMIAQYFEINSIPTTLFTKEGQILRKFVGLVNFETLKQLLEKYKK
ncbi:MAG: thioredoxin family protein [Candidatus Hermodarchaeota archaeon]